jgi:hypothetical protein
MRPTLGHKSMSELEAQYMRLTMMLNQLPITYYSEISKTLQSIIKLRTEELRKHQEQCPVLSMSHDDSMNQMTDEYNIESSIIWNLIIWLWVYPKGFVWTKWKC